MNSVTRRLLLAAALLSSAGIIVSAVSLHHHYGRSKTSYCDIGENFDCDIVNRSTYSSVAGIPVALIGILGYASLLALATVYRGKAESPAIMFIGSLAGLSFAVYLTYIEGYVLATWCVLCLSSLGLISLITVLSGVWLGRSLRKE